MDFIDKITSFRLFLFKFEIFFTKMKFLAGSHIKFVEACSFLSECLNLKNRYVYKRSGIK